MPSIVGTEQRTVVETSEYLSGSTGVRRNHGQPRGHRLQSRQTEPFYGAGRQKDRRTRHQPVDVVAISEEPYRRCDSELLGQSLSRCAIGAVAGDLKSPPVGGKTGCRECLAPRAASASQAEGAAPSRRLAVVTRTARSGRASIPGYTTVEGTPIASRHILADRDIGVQVGAEKWVEGQDPSAPLGEMARRDERWTAAIPRERQDPGGIRRRHVGVHHIDIVAPSSHCARCRGHRGDGSEPETRRSEGRAHPHRIAAGNRDVVPGRGLTPPRAAGRTALRPRTRPCRLYAGCAAGRRSRTSPLTSVAPTGAHDRFALPVRDTAPRHGAMCARATLARARGRHAVRSAAASDSIRSPISAASCSTR